MPKRKVTFSARCAAKASGTIESMSANSSVLVRIPRLQQARKSAPSAPRLIQSEERKAKVACEPMVSVLTEIAKRLQPGRCVT